MKYDVVIRLDALSKILDLERDRETLQDAVKEIKTLREENESVWMMLEEIKASDIKKHKKHIESAVAEKLLTVLAKNRGKFDEPN